MVEEKEKLEQILLNVREEEGKILKTMIVRAKMKHREAQAELNKLIWECGRRGHIVTKRELSGGAYCALCRTPLGWWCPKSPDHLCHYPDRHNRVFYEPTCKYCGEPDERK